MQTESETARPGGSPLAAREVHWASWQPQPRAMWFSRRRRLIWGCRTWNSACECAQVLKFSELCVPLPCLLAVSNPPCTPNHAIAFCHMSAGLHTARCRCVRDTASSHRAKGCRGLRGPQSPSWAGGCSCPTLNVGLHSHKSSCHTHPESPCLPGC